MNNDLISRSELKKAIEQGEGFSWDSLGKDDLCVRKKYIDNAPTVDKGYDFGYADGHGEGYELGKNSRPHGEWIECTKSGMPLTEYGRMTSEKWYGFKCSQCNFIYKGNALIESPYCQKCGADMRKGGVE